MAYITAEEVKEIRDRLKAAYPAKKGWKFSIRKRDSSCLHVDILEAPVKFIEDGKHVDVNHYWIHDSSFTKEQKAILEDINTICNKTNWDNSEPMNDYFNCHFYFNLKIGNWEKPFKYAEGYSIAEKLEALGF